MRKKIKREKNRPHFRMFFAELVNSRIGDDGAPPMTEKILDEVTWAIINTIGFSEREPDEFKKIQKELRSL